MGTTRTKVVARTVVYWTGINRDIESIIKNCETCAKYQNTPPKLPLQHWAHPTEPWSRIHTDFAGSIFDLYLLIVIDAYSKWIRIEIYVIHNFTDSCSRLLLFEFNHGNESVNPLGFVIWLISIKTHKALFYNLRYS